jgi:hypothetical protein
MAEQDAECEALGYTGLKWDSACQQYQAWRRGVCVGCNADKAQAWGLIEEAA